MTRINNNQSDLTENEFFNIIRNITQQEAVKKFQDSESQKTKQMKVKYL